MKRSLFAVVSIALLWAFGRGCGASAAGDPAEAPGPAATTLPPTVVPGVSLLGSYIDSSQAAHPWIITAAHALRWDGAPWVPIGVAFVPSAFSSLAAGDIDAASAKLALGHDLERLDALRAAGVEDLLIEMPGEDGAALSPTDPVRFTDVPRPILQGLLDALNQRGFRFGIDIRGRLKTAAAGYEFGENFTSAQQAAPGTFIAAAPAGSDGALFVAKDRTGRVIRIGSAEADHGTIVVNATAAASVYLVTRRVENDAAGASLWDGFADLRDGVLFGLRPLKTGSGLRFFLDPIDAPVAPAGRRAYRFPASTAFQSQYEAWLQRRYPDIQSLQQRWGASPGVIKDFAAAARLIPDAATAPDAAWDPVRDVTVTIAAGNAFWLDFENFRSETARHDMDTLASSLRHNVADVPVVYRWQRFNGIYAAQDGYAAQDSPVTYDGLAYTPAEATPRADRQAAYACAQVGDAAVNRWFLIAGGSPSENMDDLRSFVSLGAKGFFVPLGSGSVVPAATALLLRYLRDATERAPSSLLPAPGRGLKIAPGAGPASAPATDASYAGFWPNIIWFPWSLQVASVRRFHDGSWWLPSFRPGIEAPVGPELEAYQMAGADQPVVIWSNGLREEHFRLPTSAHVAWPPGVDFGHSSHGLRTLSLGDEPVLLEGAAPSAVFPEDALDRVFAQTAQLKDSILLSKENRQRLQIDESTARRMKEKGQVYDAYLLLSFDLGIQRRLLLPYWWLEGEAADPHSFNGVARSSQCSGGAFLWLNNPDDPPAGKPYSASWTFHVMAAGAFEMWFGGTAPGQDWSSPVSWTLDGLPLPVQDRGPAGTAYPPIFHWTRLADVTLSQGQHTLTVTVTGRRLEPDDSYALGIDAIAFSPTDALAKQFLAAAGKAPVKG